MDRIDADAGRLVFSFLSCSEHAVFARTNKRIARMSGMPLSKRDRNTGSQRHQWQKAVPFEAFLHRKAPKDVFQIIRGCWVQSLQFKSPGTAVHWNSVDRAPHWGSPHVQRQRHEAREVLQLCELNRIGIEHIIVDGHPEGQAGPLLRKITLSVAEMPAERTRHLHLVRVCLDEVSPNVVRVPNLVSLEACETKNWARAFRVFRLRGAKVFCITTYAQDSSDEAFAKLPRDTSNSGHCFRRVFTAEFAAKLARFPLRVLRILAFVWEDGALEALLLSDTLKEVTIDNGSEFTRGEWKGVEKVERTQGRGFRLSYNEAAVKPPPESWWHSYLPCFMV